MNRPVLYIDIDGVVLVRDSSRHGFRVASYAEEFLDWAVDHFRALWLTTRAQNGDLEEVRRAFRLAGLIAGSPAWSAIERIPAVKWGASKAHAIDVHAECWWWLDDNPTPEDIEFLRQHGRLDRLVLISSGDPKALLHAQTRLSRGLSERVPGDAP